MPKDSRAAIADYAPDALANLRESFALHLDATRAPKTARIYLDALDSLIRHLEAHGMPVAARGVRREHIESYLAARKPQVAPSTLSLEYRALQQFFKWLVERGLIYRATRGSYDFALPLFRDHLRRRAEVTASGRACRSASVTRRARSSGEVVARVRAIVIGQYRHTLSEEGALAATAVTSPRRDELWMSSRYVRFDRPPFVRLPTAEPPVCRGGRPLDVLANCDRLRRGDPCWCRFEAEAIAEDLGAIGAENLSDWLTDTLEPEDVEAFADDARGRWQARRRRQARRRWTARGPRQAGRSRPTLSLHPLATSREQASSSAPSRRLTRRIGAEPCHEPGRRAAPSPRFT